MLSFPASAGSSVFVWCVGEEGGQKPLLVLLRGGEVAIPLLVLLGAGAIATSLFGLLGVEVSTGHNPLPHLLGLEGHTP